MLLNYDDRAAQALHLGNRHSGRFFAVGDRGPQPLWLFDLVLSAQSILTAKQDASSLVQFWSEGRLLLTLAGDAVAFLPLLGAAELLLALVAGSCPGCYAGVFPLAALPDAAGHLLVYLGDSEATVIFAPDANSAVRCPE